MEVKIISRETIKPSSPTPHHLRTHKLSLLDQFIPSIYVPMILFYPMKHNASPVKIIPERLQLLKQSLSKTLTHFYPLAGKIKDNLSIDCNDEGAFYVEARVDCHLSKFLSQPDLPSLHQFLPCDASWTESPIAGAHVTMIQVNIFQCGGITIGVFISHMVADGIALSAFLKGWATTARGSCEAVCPNFNAPSLFLQNDSLSRDATMMAICSPFFKMGRCITRRFVFDASAIAQLKAKATSSCVQSPTRVEAVSALIWKCAMATYKVKSGSQRPSLLTHAVNMRRRVVPPLPEYSMGNFLWLAATQCTTQIEMELDHLVLQLKEAITKINADFVEKLQGDGGFLKMSEAAKDIGGAFSNDAFSSGVDYMGFSSWCKFGLYEIDFGWGKPVWASCVGGSGNSMSLYMNFTVLMETKWGDGIEAWVTLDKEDMVILERDMELLCFASLDPSPLELCNLVSHP